MKSIFGIFYLIPAESNRHLSRIKGVVTCVLLLISMNFFTKSLNAQMHQNDSLNTFKTDAFSFGCDNLIPEFKHGGTEGLFKFLLTHLKYPGDSIIGKVIVQFEVDTLGKPCDIKIVKGLNKLADNEVLRVIPLLEFKPLSKNGKRIPVTIMLPIKFEY